MKLFLVSITLVILIISVFLFAYFRNNKSLNLVSTSTSVTPSTEKYPSVNLDSIFTKGKHNITTTQDQSIVITATGDIIPARSVNYQTVSRNNFIWPYQPTLQLFENSDITFINLEAPFVQNCPVTQEGMVFCSDTRNIEGLSYIKANIANLANNHSTNYGQQGIESTINLLKSAGIQAVGISGPQYIEVKGSKVAFLGYNDIGNSDLIASANESLVSKEVSQAKSEANLVIVAFHWGNEYTSQPTERQVKLAHLAVDSGADLIIGNHPHWVQPAEIYHDKLIVYAHGNFIFDQMWSQKTKEGVIGRYTFYKNKLIDAQFTPILIKDYGQATIPDTEASNQILKQMQEESRILLNRTM